METFRFLSPDIKAMILDVLAAIPLSIFATTSPPRSCSLAATFNYYRQQHPIALCFSHLGAVAIAASQPQIAAANSIVITLSSPHLVLSSLLPSNLRLQSPTALSLPYHLLILCCPGASINAYMTLLASTTAISCCHLCSSIATSLASRCSVAIAISSPLPLPHDLAVIVLSPLFWCRPQCCHPLQPPFLCLCLFHIIIALPSSSFPFPHCHPSPTYGSKAAILGSRFV
ncbi:hypothetical protein BHE74_00050837 [Ensete ventricosum]|nr:hypothetical protein BHE74_00050837 [Ensete ventricosum]